MKGNIALHILVTLFLASVLYVVDGGALDVASSNFVDMKADPAPLGTADADTRNDRQPVEQVQSGGLRCWSAACLLHKEKSLINSAFVES